MALLNLVYVAQRPITDLRADAFLLNTIVNRPSFAGYINDWGLSTTVPSPTFVSEVISGAWYSLNHNVASPITSSVQIQGNLFSSQLTVRPPSTNLTFYSEIYLSLNKTLPRPLVSIFNASSAVLELATATYRPQVTAVWLNDLITNSSKTYVLNTMNSAHSEYLSFAFNSLFKLGSDYYGVNSTGIHKLTGDLDGASVINSEVATPVSGFDKQGTKACTDAYVLARLEGDIEVCVRIDEQEERTGFRVNGDSRQGLHRRRVKIPKGLKGAVWQAKVKNVDGSQFSVNALELSLRELQRVE